MFCKSKRCLQLLLLSLSISLSALSFALTLDEAKDQGLLGEQADGFLGVVKATPESSELKDTINKQRLALYQEIAKRNGTELQAVEQLAGKKAIEKSVSGQFVKPSSGSWTKVP